MFFREVFVEEFYKYWLGLKERGIFWMKIVEYL